jgi:hypothetical protein
MLYETAASRLERDHLTLITTLWKCHWATTDFIQPQLEEISLFRRKSGRIVVLHVPVVKRRAQKTKTHHSTAWNIHKHTHSSNKETKSISELMRPTETSKKIIFLLLRLYILSIVPRSICLIQFFSLLSPSNHIACVSSSEKTYCLYMSFSSRVVKVSKFTCHARPPPNLHSVSTVISQINQHNQLWVSKRALGCSQQYLLHLSQPGTKFRPLRPAKRGEWALAICQITHNIS